MDGIGVPFLMDIFDFIDLIEVVDDGRGLNFILSLHGNAMFEAIIAFHFTLGC